MKTCSRISVLTMFAFSALVVGFSAAGCQLGISLDDYTAGASDAGAGETGDSGNLVPNDAYTEQGQSDTVSEACVSSATFAAAKSSCVAPAMVRARRSCRIVAPQTCCATARRRSVKVSAP